MDTPLPSTHTIFIAMEDSPYLVQTDELESAIEAAGFRRGSGAFEPGKKHTPYIEGNYETLSESIESESAPWSRDRHGDPEAYDCLVVQSDGTLRLTSSTTRQRPYSYSELTDDDKVRHRLALARLEDRTTPTSSFDRVVTLRTAWELGALKLSDDDLDALEAVADVMEKAHRDLFDIIDPINARRVNMEKEKSRDDLGR